MEKAKFSFAWVISVIALMAYSYISFMGTVYLQVFNVSLCVLLTLAADFLVLLLVRLMCGAKSTRWIRLGVIGQAFFGFLVFAILLGSSVLFTHFTRIIRQNDNIKEAYAAAVEDARTMDEKYDEYVRSRCEGYAASLYALPPSSPEYKAVFGNSMSLGFTKKEIVSKCVANLGKLLKGKNQAGELTEKRGRWLADASASVWNLSLPANIRDITSSVNLWLENYKKLSVKTYTGESGALPYKNTSFNRNISVLESLCSGVKGPSVLAVILAVVCYALILLPWIITPKNIASVGGDFDDVVLMPDEDE
ncbi:MAG TPA: hypothetical protein DDX40_10185 [Rikenellaceae bacterium]|nr:hypothetical protein [Rikenellaceae bacterium]